MVSRFTIDPTAPAENVGQVTLKRLEDGIQVCLDGPAPRCAVIRPGDGALHAAAETLLLFLEYQEGAQNGPGQGG